MSWENYQLRDGITYKLAQIVKEYRNNTHKKCFEFIIKNSYESDADTIVSIFVISY